MRGWLAALLMIAAPVFAAPLPELKLLSEHPVDDMIGGNLSGLASCNGVLWTVSDRDDAILYSLDTKQTVWKARQTLLDIPPVPDSGLPLTLRSMAKASALIRGGNLDFEGVTCDAAGNRYLVSEAYASVLKVPVNGAPVWLDLPKKLVQEAQAAGMLAHFNAIFEGIAINAAGDQLWLAAERDNRGILIAHLNKGVWQCTGSCILRVESGEDVLPKEVGGQPLPKDFADISLFRGKLYALERAAYRVCRRTLETGQIEACWSFAKEALRPNRLYDQKFGLTEALVVDEKGAWIGVDNNFGARADGEKRPIVWRFAAPEGGWSGKP
ncbi:esterase-like activity of phytase family protein [Pseudomonas huanghezhanensis]|uniref:esterase-like activity of phytase family protein n=1 Tax=Pseudomonas huanghezhanensis TaxID=3002903 RepID=UPI002285D482|nr:esterase-like activity of phytase family protein [Pseudomonas sp. BSw22131]